MGALGSCWRADMDSSCRELPKSTNESASVVPRTVRAPKRRGGLFRAEQTPASLSLMLRRTAVPSGSMDRRRRAEAPRQDLQNEEQEKDPQQHAEGPARAVTPPPAVG